MCKRALKKMVMYLSPKVFWESSPSFHNAVRYTNVNGLIEIPFERCVVQKLLKDKLRNWTNKTMAVYLSFY
jgi:hypothetical protein